MQNQFGVASNMISAASSNGAQGVAGQVSQANPTMATVYDNSKQVINSGVTNGAQGAAMTAASQAATAVGGQAGQAIQNTADITNQFAGQKDVLGAAQSAM